MSTLLIVDALVAVASTDHASTRNLLLREAEQFLRTEHGAAELNVERHSERRLDLVSIVNHVLRQPSGAWALREAARVVFGAAAIDAAAALQALDAVIDSAPSRVDRASWSELQDALDGVALPAHVDVPLLYARATTPVPLQTSVATLTQAVERLERLATVVYLFRFLEFAASYSIATDARDALHHWVDQHITLVPVGRRREVTELRTELAGQLAAPDARTVLLIRLDPVEDGLFTVSAWLGQTDGPHGANCGPEDVVSLAEIRRWLAELIGDHRTGALDPTRGPLIEFLLPPECFGMDPDAWPVGGAPLGAVYQVTIRPTETSPARGARLMERWQILVAAANGSGTALDSARWLDSTVPPLADHPAESHWAWIAITCPLMTRSDHGVSAVLDSGAPVAAWLRGEHPRATRREALDQLGRGRAVTELRRTVRKWRELSWGAGHTDHRRDLVLLWDDPTRPPPQDHRVSAPLAED